jgi:hypothetical protein
VKLRPGADNVPPDSTNNLALYLKVPARYSGNNFQVEVTKCDYNGTPIPTKVAGLSSIYTAWKRVYVERDSMFRRGNLFDADVTAPPAGQLYLARWDSTTPASDKIYVQGGDQVVVFDKDHPYPGPGTLPYETATILGTPAPAFFDAPKNGGGTKSVLRVYLDHNLTQTYTPSPFTFDSGSSAAVGVVHSADNLIYDTSPNRLPNGPGSAFYDADMGDIEQPFDDAYVEFIAPRSGMGAVPYLPQAWFSATGNDSALRLFHQTWFANKNPMSPPNQEFNNPHNYFHLIGASSAIDPVGPTWVNGISYKLSDISYVFVGSIDGQCGSCTATQKANHVRETSEHELAHQFGVNQCNSAGHDLNNAWCGGSGGTCDNTTYGFEYCIMHSYDVTYSLPMRTDGISKLDCDDLASTGRSCGIPACSNGISVRTDTDPE